MFHLYQHHDLTTLAELLAALGARAGAGSPLVPDTVLVPNRGTARWLQAELAEAEGAAANLELPVPGRFVWRVLRDTLPGSPDSAEYERGALVWHLYALLPSVAVPAVQRYLAAEPRERQRYQLAVRLADVFDQYLIHRRDVLAEWEARREERFPPASWQAPVWRAVVDRLEKTFGQRDRAKLLAEFLQRAEDGTLDASALPDPVHAFALADLPADYLRLLHALGQYVDVHFLLPNPSAAYWGDVRRVPVAGPGESPEADPGFRSASSGLRDEGDERHGAAGGTGGSSDAGGPLSPALSPGGREGESASRDAGGSDDPAAGSDHALSRTGAEPDHSLSPAHFDRPCRPLYTGRSRAATVLKTTPETPNVRKLSEAESVAGARTMLRASCPTVRSGGTHGPCLCCGELGVTSNAGNWACRGVALRRRIRRTAAGVRKRFCCPE